MTSHAPHVLVWDASALHHPAKTDRQDDLAELTAYVYWSDRIGTSGGHDAGEATVLAWAAVHGAVTIVDDRAARRAAQAGGVEAHGTLWLLADALRSGRAGAGLLRTLEQSGAWLPHAAVADFPEWAKARGLL